MQQFFAQALAPLHSLIRINFIYKFHWMALFECLRTLKPFCLIYKLQFITWTIYTKSYLPLTICSRLLITLLIIRISCRGFHAGKLSWLVYRLHATFGWLLQLQYTTCFSFFINLLWFALYLISCVSIVFALQITNLFTI